MMSRKLQNSFSLDESSCLPTLLMPRPRGPVDGRKNVRRPERDLRDLEAVGIVTHDFMKGPNAPYTLIECTQQLLAGIDTSSPKN